MKNIRIDDNGVPRCWNCGSKGLTEKRTLRSKADHRGGDQQHGATSNTISRPGERIGVFGAFAAGRVCHRSQEPRDRRGRHHAPHPAQERPDHAPLRPNLRPVDPQCHHRREPLIAATPAPVPPLSAYLAKRCPRRVQLNLVEPAVPLEPTTNVQMRLDEGIAFEASVVAELRQWPAPTGCSSTRPHPPGLQVEATTSAIAARWAVVVGARLPNDAAAARSGAPDVLVCDRGGYVAVDVKHHRTIDAGDAVPHLMLDHEIDQRLAIDKRNGTPIRLSTLSLGILRKVGKRDNQIRARGDPSHPVARVLSCRSRCSPTASPEQLS